jgi:hypothetical protein
VMGSFRIAPPCSVRGAQSCRPRPGTSSRRSGSRNVRTGASTPRLASTMLASGQQRTLVLRGACGRLQEPDPHPGRAAGTGSSPSRGSCQAPALAVIYTRSKGSGPGGVRSWSSVEAMSATYRVRNETSAPHREPARETLYRRAHDAPLLSVLRSGCWAPCQSCPEGAGGRPEAGERRALRVPGGGRPTGDPRAGRDGWPGPRVIRAHAGARIQAALSATNP